MKVIHTIITLGYILIVMLIGCIGCIWVYEWCEIEQLELNNQEIDKFRKDVNNIHIRLIEFSLLGETVLDWNEADLENYHAQRIALDSTLCLVNKKHLI